MAQEGEGHGGDCVGALQYTVVTNDHLALLRQGVRGHVGRGKVCVVVITIWVALC